MCQGDARLPSEDGITTKGTQRGERRKNFQTSLTGPSHLKRRPPLEEAGFVLRANGMPGLAGAKMKDVLEGGAGLTLPGFF